MLVSAERVRNEIIKAIESWTHSAAQGDNGKPEWTRGVIYGLTLSLRYLRTD